MNSDFIKPTQLNLFNFRSSTIRVFHITWFNLLPLLLRLVWHRATDANCAG